MEVNAAVTTAEQAATYTQKRQRTRVSSTIDKLPDEVKTELDLRLAVILSILVDTFNSKKVMRYAAASKAA